jgi:hypothetical protein
LTKPCPICGKHRSYAFAPFDYDSSEEIEVLVKHESNVTTLTAFTQWLLYFEQEMAKEMRAEEDVQRDLGLIEGSEEEEELEDDNEEAMEARPKKEKTMKFKAKYETVAYAHAGSRYDNVMVIAVHYVLLNNENIIDFWRDHSTRWIAANPHQTGKSFV